MSGNLTQRTSDFLRLVSEVRFWLCNVGRPYPPLAVVRRQALAELRSNQTITTYKFLDGKEIRRPGDPWARFRELVVKATNALKSVGLWEVPGDLVRLPAFLGTRPEYPFVFYRETGAGDA